MPDQAITEPEFGNPFRRDSELENRFRLEVRDWIFENLPVDLRDRVGRPDPELFAVWQGRLFRRGWSAPHWPRKFGGMGAGLRTQLILTEEMVRAGAPQMVVPGLAFIGPLIIEFGTDEQRAQHLPGILSGEVVWAQGYSEPNAGSDLSALQTRAKRHGDAFVVNGHKVWQTWGHHADWMFTLVRTDAAAPKHEGISCLLIDLKTPGITVRSIDTIAGEDELSEVLLDDVSVAVENLVGPINGGWRVANALLAHERLAGSNPQFTLSALQKTRRIADDTGVIENPDFALRLAQLEIRVMAQTALFETAVQRRENGTLQDAETSVLKLVATETLQAITDLMLEAAGPRGIEVGEEGPAAAGFSFLQSRRATIFGGTREIHRNIVARRILGMGS